MFKLCTFLAIHAPLDQINAWELLQILWNFQEWSTTCLTSSPTPEMMPKGSWFWTMHFASLDWHNVVLVIHLASLSNVAVAGARSATLTFLPTSIWRMDPAWSNLLLASKDGMGMTMWLSGGKMEQNSAFFPRPPCSNGELNTLQARNSLPWVIWSLCSSFFFSVHKKKVTTKVMRKVKRIGTWSRPWRS